MKPLILLAALLLLLHPASRADAATGALLDQAGLSKLEALSEALGGPDVQHIVSAALAGQLEIGGNILPEIASLITQALRNALLPALSALASPVLIALVLRMVLGAQTSPVTLLCRLSCVYSLGKRCVAAMETAKSGMIVAAQIADTASPVVAAALALTGRATSAAALTPLTALCLDGIENALIAWGLPLCGVAAAVAAAGGMSEHFRLDRLFGLICRTVTWSVGLMLAAFVGLMTLEGRLAAARDGASVQAVRQALKGLIPGIGNSVTDSSGALLESALTVRNAVGATGLLIALAAAVKPALALMAHMLSVKVASALIEPVADPGIVRVTACYGEIGRLLLMLYAGSALLSALLAGAGLGLLGF